jgi:hypothetical protein
MPLIGRRFILFHIQSVFVLMVAARSIIRQPHMRFNNYLLKIRSSFILSYLAGYVTYLLLCDEYSCHYPFTILCPIVGGYKLLYKKFQIKYTTLPIRAEVY